MGKDIISYLLSFILVLLIIAISCLIIFSNTFNAKYIQNKLSESNYYEKLQETIDNGFDNYIMQSGMDSSVFNNIYDINKLKEDTNHVILAIFNNTELSINNEAMREKLDSNIRSYIRENNLLVNKTAENQIQIFEDTIINTYNNSVTYSASVIKSLGNIFNKINKIIPVAIVITTVMIVLNVIFLIIINKQNKKRLLSNISVILLTLAGLSIIGIILEKNFLNIQSLTVLNENVSILIQIIVKDIYRVLYLVAAIGLVAGISTSLIAPKTNKSRH